jgi:hypothetical protein
MDRDVTEEQFDAALEIILDAMGFQQETPKP